MLPFTVCSCDNILHNGNVARNAVIGLAALSGDQALAQWVAGNVAFPNGKYFDFVDFTLKND
jgi:mannitol 2-dehydrogenase